MKEICAHSLSQKRWLLRPYEEAQVLALMQKLEVSPTLARLLIMRGQNLDSAPLFLEPTLRHHLPDPLTLKDMEKAVFRLLRAIMHQEKIVVWGDYDVDGATSSALLCRFFKSIGISVTIYIPDRLKEGYGPNIAGMQKFREQGYTVMITVDCGTTSFEALEGADGLDVIILDHHAPEARLPVAYAVVNPNRLDESADVTHSLGHLAAVGLSFLCVVALNRALRKEGFYGNQKEPDLFSLLDLVALGTVCDVMPLTGLNRAFVTQGLKVLAMRKNIGLKTLSDIAGIDEAPTPYHLGFILGPRINASGRVGESSLGARLLSTDNPEEAFDIAQKLEAYNRERRTLESTALEQAFLLADPALPALVLDHKGWHEGIIGIIAGRLKDKFHKPTAIITWNNQGVGKGSARSIPGFDFGRFIHKAHRLGYVLGGGGHAMAAGFTLTKDQLPLFTSFLMEELVQLEKEIDLNPLILSDGYLDLRSLTPALMEEINTLSPFGMGNPGPKFVFTHVMVDSYHTVHNRHIRCRFSQGDGIVTDGIGFHLKDTILGNTLMDRSRRPLDLLASPKLDTWGSTSKVTLVVEDAAYASSPLKMVG